MKIIKWSLENHSPYIYTHTETVHVQEDQKWKKENKQRILTLQISITRDTQKNQIQATSKASYPAASSLVIKALVPHTTTIRYRNHYIIFTSTYKYGLSGYIYMQMLKS